MKYATNMIFNKQVSVIALLIIVFNCTSYAQGIVWADSLASFSSEYSTPLNTKAYKAIQILGSPNCMAGIYNESECAWASSLDDGAYEYIEVIFKNPVKAKQLIVIQNLNPGTITGVELFDKNHKLIVSQTDSSGFRSSDDNFPLHFYFPDNQKPVTYVKLTLNTSLVMGYNQIDAIGLCDNSITVSPGINNVPGSDTTSARELLTQSVNSPFKELLPQITSDGKILYFTRENHPDNFGYIAGISSQDIWFSETDNEGKFKPAEKFTEPINNKLDNSLCSITPDGQKALLLNVYNLDGTMTNGISMALRENDLWQFPSQIMMDDYYNSNKFGEYCLSASGRIIVMTVERGDSYGSKDCYVSFVRKDGTWTKPKNLGRNINTAASEVSPFLAADEITLYYSTSGLPGYGKQDIFMTRRLDSTWTKWSEPQNLGPKINSTSFDAYYSIQASGEYAYFSSLNGENFEDIYRIKLPTLAKPLPIVLIKGIVRNAKTGQPIGSKIIYESLKDGKEIGEANSEASTGYYSIALTAGEKYGFRGIAPGFIPISENIDLTALTEYQEINRDLSMVPMEIGQIVRLNNIFFEFNQAILMKETYPELERLVRMMKDYPTMQIEIHGHTDSKGTDQYNLNLSLRRAKTVHDYLLSKSIDKSRISYKGFGESKPITTNETDDGRQLNRRVEFLIIQM
jgi:outer membrane protein OmpA-like peptidoglycan-associated protein